MPVEPGLSSHLAPGATLVEVAAAAVDCARCGLANGRTQVVFGERDHTTLAVVVTDAALDKAACRLLARSAHDGFARALRPAHTRFDGDLSFAVATGVVNGHLDRLCEAAAVLTAEAIRDAVVTRGG